MISSKQTAIFSEIASEREYQDSLWGGPESDDRNSQPQWSSYITEYANMSSPRTKNRPFRERMLKVAALAVAAIESFDRLEEVKAEAIKRVHKPYDEESVRPPRHV
jgi:hypothetical protein